MSHVVDVDNVDNPNCWGSLNLVEQVPSCDNVAENHDQQTAVVGLLNELLMKVEEAEEEVVQPGPNRSGYSTLGFSNKKEIATKMTFGEGELENYNITSFIEEFMEFMKKLAHSILPLLKGDENKAERIKQLKRLHNVGVQMIEIQEKINIIPDCVKTAFVNLNLEEKAEQELNSTQLDALFDEFEKASMQEVKERGKEIRMKDVYRNETYQSYLEVLDEYVVRRDKGRQAEEKEEEVTEPPVVKTEPPSPPENNDDQDMDVDPENPEILTDYLPTKDPFTYLPLTDPYENRICKHVYEYCSIMACIIKSGGKTKCPYPGCRNDKYISVDDLFINPDLSAKIKQRIQDEKYKSFFVVD